jgi:hypothetical protein
MNASVAKDISRQLAGVRGSGKAPEFEILDFSLYIGGDSEIQKFRFSLVILIDGEKIEVIEEDECCPGSSPKKGSGFRGKIDSVNMMDRAFRRAILKRYPELTIIEEFCFSSYVVHAVDTSGVGHHVQVVMGLENHKGRWTLRLVGSDISQLTLKGFHNIYHWMLWRLLRRQRGEARRSKV